MRRQGSQHASGPRVETALQQPLEALFDPSSIAVVGASDDQSKWGHILARRALESSGDRPVTLVNRTAREVLGRPTYPTLAAARADGAAVDLVVVCVPSAGLVDAVRRRGRGRCPDARGDHRRPVRDRCGRGSDGAGGAADRPGGRRRAGRAELHRSGRHRHQPPAQPRRAAAGRRHRAQPERQHRARPGGAARGPGPGHRPVRVRGQPGRRERGRPDASPVWPTTAPGRSPCTPRTWWTAGRSSPLHAPSSTPASRSSCSRLGARRRRCAGPGRTPAR